MANLTWGYGEENGPSHWGETARDALGRHQSPINIIPSEAEFDKRLAEHHLHLHYSDHNCHSMENNGHSVQVTVTDDPTHISKISGGPLHHNHFHLKQFHFHWGSEYGHGSEHTIDGKAYDAELHLVHWDSLRFQSFEEAAEAHQGLIVLAVFIKSGNEHKGLKALTNLFGEITYAEDLVAIPDGFNPKCLLPDDLTKYWTYSGSLTTPPCHESVEFVIFKHHIEISEGQLNAFRRLRPRPFTRKSSAAETTCCRLVNNCRPTMPLNGRQVKSSFRKFFA